MRVEFGDGTTTADHSSAHVISRAFPNTYGQPLAHFLRATAKVPDAQIIAEHPVIRFILMLTEMSSFLRTVYLVNLNFGT